VVLTFETFERLAALYARGPDGRREAPALAGRIRPEALAAWLADEVANPAAERYLLALFHGEDGAAAGNVAAYRRFYRELTARRRPGLRREVIEGGEISRVSYLTGAALTGWRHPDSGAPMAVIYKRMPPFLDRAEAEEYVARYREYNSVLRDEVGIPVPHFDARIVDKGEQVIIYVIQARLDEAAVCHTIMQGASPQAAEALFRAILREYVKLYRYNQARAAEGYQVGLDGQLPNWAVAGYGGAPEALTGEERLLYLDTNVPMIRIDGQDVVSTDVYFQALPGAARWLIKRLNLDEEVMERYFHLRSIMLDFLGNLIVRHRPDLVPRLVEMSNEALAGAFAAEEWPPFSVEEVERYYRSDVFTWRLWRSLKLLGAISDGVSAGQWRALGRFGELYPLWTQPIF
jgi:hypothetical protein